MKQSFIGSFFSKCSNKYTPQRMVIASSNNDSNIELLSTEKNTESSGLRHSLFFEGCSKGNPGPSGAGAVIYEMNGNTKAELWARAFYVGPRSTNNIAEYTGLLIGMGELVRRNIRQIDIFGDSELVIKQMKGIYKVNNPGLKTLYEKAKTLELQFDEITYTHIYREKNTRADALSNEGLESR